MSPSVSAQVFLFASARVFGVHVACTWPLKGLSE